MINKYFQNKIKSDFLKNILLLLSGSVIAQLIVVLVSPILTRLYEPTVFGASALFLSISSILMVLVTGRYEMAIVQTKKDHDGLSLVLISIFLSIFFSILLYLFYSIFHNINYLINLNEQINGYILLIPLFLIFNVITKSLNNYFNRNKDYKTITSNQINLSVSQSIGKLSLGFYKLSSNGIILGNILGYFVTTLFIVHRYYKSCFDFVKLIIAWKRMRYNLVKFKDFPKVLLFSDGINTVAYQLPFILTSYYFSLEKLGYLSLAYSMSSIPLSFIGTSISRVFRQKMSEEFNKNGKCDELFKTVLIKIIITITFPFILLFFLAPWLFETIFGQNWIESGYMVQILIIMFYFQFIARIFNYMYILSNHQKENLFLQIYIFIGVLGSYSITYYFTNNLEITLLVFSITYSSIYLFSIIESYKFSKGVKYAN